MYFGKTYFSFKYGTFSTKELVTAGVETGIKTIALTNINSTCDAWDFVFSCRENDIKPILGVEIRNDNTLLYILLAANNNGFRQINEFLSAFLLEKKPFPECPAGISIPAVCPENPIPAPAACPEKSATAPWPALSDVFIIYPLHTRQPGQLLENERIGVLPEEAGRLLKAPLDLNPGKWVIRQPVTFQNKTYYNLHRLLRAIDRNTLLTKLKPDDLAGEKETFLPQSRIIDTFKNYPHLITNTYRLFDACSIDMKFGEDKNKKVHSASREDDRVLLEKLAREGLQNRYSENPPAQPASPAPHTSTYTATNTPYHTAESRLAKELCIIDKMGFTAYFLITWDMIRYAHSRGFYHVGRGSGANSLVAYCLRITDVDPIELDLYFERFLNPHRTSPPDFDIDFSYRDRDEVIDYMMKRYGSQHIALLGMYSTFQYNAIVRELGKVFGLPKEEIDRLATKGYYRKSTSNQNFMKQTQEDKIARIILQYGKLLQNFPSNLSIHPGGILISEEPLFNYCTLYRPPKGFSTCQLDMFVAENIGLYKLDVLSQRGLGHIKESVELIKANKQIDIDIHNSNDFKKDPFIQQQLKTGNTIGCFYIESPAMRQLIKKLHCDNYETLVAASSIIRPGVGSSGMMAQYIQRHHNPDGFQYPHEKLKELLKATYGVMIYQEQVIQVAHEWAGLDMADADMLRRATSGKYRGQNLLTTLKEKFFGNCANLSYPARVVEDVWRQIESFAEYSFCKAHSASYAVESYQSLYLKTYYPMEFAVAVINNFGGFYSRELYFYELMRAGATVHRPCVNNSDDFTNIHGKDAWVGFVHIKGLEQTTATTIVKDRHRRGRYTSLADFIERTSITSEQLDLLIRTCALRFTGKSKKQLLWEGDFLQKKNKTHSQAWQPLFKEAPTTFSLPVLPGHPLEDIYDDIELLGFPVADPFTLVDDDPARYTPARALSSHLGKTVTVLGYHITQKPVRTVKGDTMSFGTFLDANKEWIDTVHFPEIHARHPPRAGFYRITGKVVQEFGVHTLEVHHIEKAGIKQLLPLSGPTT